MNAQVPSLDASGCTEIDRLSTILNDSYEALMQKMREKYSVTAFLDIDDGGVAGRIWWRRHEIERGQNKWVLIWQTNEEVAKSHRGVVIVHTPKNVRCVVASKMRELFERLEVERIALTKTLLTSIEQLNTISGELS